MSCNCPDTNKCPDTTINCLCGIYLDIYDNQGNLIETLDSGGYLEPVEGVRFYFLDSTVFPVVPEEGGVLYIEYNDGAWGLWYQVNGDSLPYLVTSLTTTSNCPISSCDWTTAIACNCLTVTINQETGSVAYTANVVGTYDGLNVYSFDLDGTTIYIWYDAGKGWVMTLNGYGGIEWPEVAFSSYDGTCPDSISELFVWTSILILGDITTEKCPSSLYTFKTRLIECECCEDGLTLTITHSTYNDGQEFQINADVVKDQYGIELIVNGKRYYSFVLNIGGIDYTYYLLFDNTRWLLTNSLYLDNNPSYPVYTSYNTITDCPYGYYFPNKPFERFWVRGNCFDCCDYYAPRNRNLLKKKKAIFVDEISAIRNQEIFGLKCGGSWDDLFRKHLIFDVLNCLPYGVLCEEEEQCLINNLNENCNC